jgi:hypothetical protein
MRQHSVTRIFAMATISVYQPDDHPSVLRWLIQWLVWLLANRGQKNMFEVEQLFGDKERAQGVEGTAYRIGIIVGGADEESWWKDRKGEVYDGPVAGQGWSVWQKRAQLARWLVEAAVDGRRDLVGRMPAVSRRVGGKGKDE